MSQRESRISYGLTLALLAVLLYLFGSPILLVALVLLAALPLGMKLLLEADARHLALACVCPRAAQVGKKIRLELRLDRERKPRASRCVHLTLCIHNALTGEETREALILPIWGDGRSYSLGKFPQDVGELVITCEDAWLEDHLELFRKELKTFPAQRVRVYPQSVNVDVALDRQGAGSPWADGPMQNRQGSDQSETFDIREYRPGDDVRAIHWKLSVKAGEPIIRVPGSPVFYDLAVLPDFGILNENGPVSSRQRNAAMAYGSAVLRKMVQKGIRCCLALPEPEGIRLLEVDNQQDYRSVMAQWITTPLLPNSGDAMRLFRSQHLDGTFSRLLLINTGELTRQQSLTGIRADVTVLSVVEGGSGETVELGSIRVAELPERPERNRTYRVCC